MHEPERSDRSCRSIAALALGAVFLLAAPGAGRASDWSTVLRHAVAQRTGTADTAPTATVAPLSRDEAARIWDAFLTAVIKRAGQDASRGTLRDELLALLLDERHEIVSTLATATAAGPVWLTDEFGSTWKRLDPLLDRVATELPPEQAAAYRHFLATGRLTQAARAHGWLDAAGTSPASLRQLAYQILPDGTPDPLVYDEAVDPELRETFGFGPPIPMEATRSILGSMPRASFEVGPLGRLARIAAGAADWLVPAADAATGASGWDRSELVDRLNDWIPARGDLGSYLAMLQQMLDTTSTTLARRRLEPEYFHVYRNLVLTTAWQESCWRQYVKKDSGEIEPVRGPGPSLGLMQINTRVWRGLYDPKGLAADIGYNGRAGAEILYHYLRKHALPSQENLAPGGDPNLARATWAAYNGGPAHMRRYRKHRVPSDVRARDHEFWEKYQAVDRDDVSAFKSCSVGS
jgi:hypothetical protein